MPVAIYTIPFFLIVAISACHATISGNTGVVTGTNGGGAVKECPMRTIGTPQIRDSLGYRQGRGYQQQPLIHPSISSSMDKSLSASTEGTVGEGVRGGEANLPLLQTLLVPASFLEKAALSTTLPPIQPIFYRRRRSRAFWQF